MKILMTSGGTEEPIDGVRYITNFSTGKTGAVLADRLTELGAEVTLLHGHRAILPAGEMKKESFTSFQDLNEKMKTHLASGRYDAVIHLAAVSDFSVDYIETDHGEILQPDDHGKISSDEGLNLHLKRNFKILQKLRDYCPEGEEPVIAGFKLTDTDSVEEMEAAVKKLLLSGRVNFVVHNNLRDITADKHPARIYVADGNLLYRTETKEEMADKIYSLLNRYFGGHEVSDPKDSRQTGEMK